MLSQGTLEEYKDNFDNIYLNLQKNLKYLFTFLLDGALKQNII